MTRLLVVAVAFTSQASAQQSSPKVLERYQCQGTGEEMEYKTPLAVSQKGENYLLKWDASYGMGFRHNDDLVVAFITGGTVGVILYHIEDGRLVGWWTGGNGRIYRETCSAGLNAKGGDHENPNQNLSG